MLDQRETRKGLILLDRDGVLNRMIVNPDHGTIDSPLHPDQVEIINGVPEALLTLTRAGYGISIVTNQPAAARHKTTRENLERAHARVLELAQSLGGRVTSSHICFHTDEDGCSCRKPKPGLLEEAFARNPGFSRDRSWMVGDGIWDIQAGAALGLKTVFLGPQRCYICSMHQNSGVNPTVWTGSLAEWVRGLVNA